MYVCVCVKSLNIYNLIQTYRWCLAGGCSSEKERFNLTVVTEVLRITAGDNESTSFGQTILTQVFRSASMTHKSFSWSGNTGQSLRSTK